MAEVATVVSAATALAALVFAVVGLTGGTGGPGGAGGTTRSPGPPGATSAPPAERPSASPTVTALTASLAVPDGWKIKEDDALRVNRISPDLDFRWEGESRPSRRMELFVAGEHGRVYQLLAEDKHLDRSSELTTLFKTARTHLRTDVP
ncbi:hypothetical protein [Streptomyces erythrochromogenes]|uniref:hypothetical protein n=1 Tax=Streptomyces erythrochromogenes TaxID=285574 RepID=UPI0033CDE4E3